MSFTEKKTRIRKLPPRLQLNEVSSLTGSYPIKVRSAVVDNRTGLNLRPFDDQATTTIFAATSSTPEMSYTSTLVSVPYRPGQDLQPFRDSGQQAADQKSFLDPFWTTGSNVPTFEGPLWSKNKIEINLTPVSQSAITASYGDSFEAAFNFNTRMWEASGYGQTPDDVVVVPDQYKEVYYGFTPSFHPHVINTALESRGKPFSNFGFPCMWNINSNQATTFHVSQAINRPFLLEKIYVQISASYVKGAGPRGAFGTVPDLFLDAVDYDNNALYGASPVIPQVSNSYVVNNFFVLNRRKNARRDLRQLYALNIQTDYEKYFFKPVANKNSYDGAELVTWFEIASFNDNFGYVTESLTNPNKFYRDVTIVDSSSTDAFFSSWSQNLQMSGALRVPNLADFNNPDSLVLDYQGLTIRILTAGWVGGRNGLSEMAANGRDIYRATQNITPGAVGASSYTPSPYLLLPTDKLSFRWQMPIPETNNSFIFNPNVPIPSSSYVIFPAYPAKVVLYGSFVSEGECENDSLNQVLSSDNIHEDIE